VRHHLGTALILGFAGLVAVALHNLDLSPEVHDAMRGRTGDAGVQLRSIEGWSYRHTDPGSGEVVWQAWGREARPLGGGHDTWSIRDPRLVVPRLGEQEESLIISARTAVLSRRGRNRDTVQLDDGVALEWGSIQVSTQRVLVEVREDAATGERLPTAVADQPVDLSVGFASDPGAGPGGAPARLGAAGMEVQAARGVATLSPPVALSLPARALDAAAGTRLTGRLVSAPGLPPREVAPGDTLRVTSEHPVELRERAPGHVETRFTGPFRLALDYADETPALVLDGARRGAFTVGVHPPADATARYEVALEGLTVEGGRIAQEGRLAGVAHAFTMTPDGGITLTGDADGPADLHWSGSRVRARHIRFLPEPPVLVLESDVDAILAPELLPERLRGRAADDGLAALSDPWRVQADRLVAGLADDGRLRHVALEGDGRHARLASQTPSDAAHDGIEVEGERISVEIGQDAGGATSEAERLEALRVVVGPTPGSRSLGSLALGQSRLTAERVVFSGRDATASAEGRVTAARVGADGREVFRGLGESLRLSFARVRGQGADDALRARLEPRSLVLDGPRGVEMRVVPEALVRGAAASAAPASARPPLELVAGRVDARLQTGPDAGGPRVVAVEARGGAGRRVRLSNPSAQPLAQRLGVDLTRQGATGGTPDTDGSAIAGPEREWLEADRFTLALDSGRAALAGDVRGLLAAPIPAKSDTGRDAAPPTLLQLSAEGLEIGLDGPLGGATRPGLAFVEASGRPGAPARLESLDRVPLSVRTGLHPPTAQAQDGGQGESPAPERLLAGGEREWLAAPRVRFDMREQTVALTGGARGRLGLVLPEELFFAAGAEGEGGRLSLTDLEADTVRLGFAARSVDSASPSLSWLLAEGDVRVRDDRNDIRAARVHYRHTERALSLSGPPLEVVASGGRYRWSPGGEVRIRLGDEGGGE
jgi:hypothetical protein